MSKWGSSRLISSRCSKIQFLLLVLKVAFLATPVVTIGCASPGATSASGPGSADRFQSFLAGRSRLSCGVSCSGAWGVSMRRAKSLHDQGLWEDLAILVLEIGHGVDLGYYYLGRSAEGLGETSAASMYYKLALAERYKCEGWFDNCLGLNVPTLSEQRLRSLGIEPQSVGLQEKPVSANQNNSVTASNHQRPKDRIIKGPKIEETTPATDTVRSYERLGDSAQPAAAPKTNIRLNSSPRSVARPQGVFGLIWGESIAAVRKKGVSLTGDRADGRFRIFTAKSLPKNISISENYLLVFDRDNGLQKIVVISINIFNDVYGFEGKEKYADLKAGWTL